MNLARARKLLEPARWRQLPWRIRAAVDGSGLIESRAAEHLGVTAGCRVDSRGLKNAHGDPLRVLLIAPRYDYGQRRRGLSYEELHFSSSLSGMGCEVIRFDFLHLTQKFGKSAMNRMLREALFRTRPDVAFFVLFGDEVEAGSLEWAKDLSIPTLNWFCDDQWRYESFSSKWAPWFDVSVTTSAVAYDKYIGDGHMNVVKSQWGFSSSLFRFAHPVSQPRHDVVFVGQPHGDRRQLIRRLASEGVAVTAFGYGWPAGRLSASEMAAVTRDSRIVLGLSNDWSGLQTQVKGRDFEVPALGSLYLTGANAELWDYFVPGEEVVGYANVDDLIEKCSYFLRNNSEREEIAAAGMDRAWREHTYEHRLLPILGRFGARAAERTG